MLTLDNFERGQMRNADASETFAADDHVALWVQLQRRWSASRGFDVGSNRRKIPRTTVGDVLSMARLWGEEAAKLADDNLSGLRRWNAAASRILDVASGRASGEMYPENERFWNETQRLAIELESLEVIPSKWTLFVESVSEAIDELPERLEAALETTKSAGTTALLIGGGALLAWAALRR